MEEKFNRLEEKLDKVAEDIVDIKVTLARNTASLDEHMRRTLATEESLDILKSEIKPIEDHVVYVNILAKHTVLYIKILGGVVALLVSLKTLGIF